MTNDEAKRWVRSGLSPAEREGFDAQWSGIPLDNNAYPGSSAWDGEWRSWRRGWFVAADFRKDRSL